MKRNHLFVWLLTIRRLLHRYCSIPGMGFAVSIVLETMWGPRRFFRTSIPCFNATVLAALGVGGTKYCSGSVCAGSGTWRGLNLVCGACRVCRCCMQSWGPGMGGGHVRRGFQETSMGWDGTGCISWSERLQLMAKSLCWGIKSQNLSALMLI